jgi:hypothetical protein
LSNHCYDHRTALIIKYPDGWKVEEEWPAFTLISFPSERRPKQLIVPLNGAEIVIMAPPRGVATIEDWLAVDRIRSDPGDKTSREKVTLVHHGAVPAVVVNYKEQRIPQGKGMIYYIVVGGKPRKVNLFYRGPTRSEYFEAVLKAILTHLQLK